MDFCDLRNVPILTLPGFSSERKRYSERAEIFRELGFAPILPELSYWKKPVFAKEGLLETIATAESALPSGRFAVFASSFGAIVASGILAGERNRDCVGAVFWNPSVSPKESIFWEAEKWAPVGDDLFRNIHPPTGEEAILSGKFLEETLLWDSAGLAGKISCPLLILQGKHDKVISIPAVERFFRRLSSEKKELVFLDSGHGWRNPSTGEKLPGIEKEAIRRTVEFFRELG